MRWKNKFTKKFKWHRWFAWYPVQLSADDTVVWLEFVYRKLTINLTCTNYIRWYSDTPLSDSFNVISGD